MDRGTWRAMVHAVAESDTRKHLSISIFQEIDVLRMASFG